MLNVGLLQFADFYTAVLSFFVTLITLANLSQRFKSFLHLMGAIAIALITQNDRTCLWTFVIPAGVATLLLFTCWVSLYLMEHFLETQSSPVCFSVRSAVVDHATHLVDAGFSPSVRHCCSPSSDSSSMRFLRLRRITPLRTGRKHSTSDAFSQLHRSPFSPFLFPMAAFGTELSH